MKLNIKLKETQVPVQEDSIPEVELSEESNDGKVYNPDQEFTQPELNGGVFSEMESQPNSYNEDISTQEPLDLLKNALLLIIHKAEALDINVDKPKLVAKLKGALEILNQN